MFASEQTAEWSCCRSCFLETFAKDNKRGVPELTREVEALLRVYPWPGNVRGLRNAIERAMIVWPTDRLEPQAFPEKIAMTSAGGTVALGRRRLDALPQAQEVGVGLTERRVMALVE